ASRKLSAGQEIKPEQLQREWVAVGYQRVEIVFEPGQFSRRGGILDIWAPAEAGPVRLDFFGDDIETIRRFDPATQRTVHNLQSVIVTPARELLPSYMQEQGLSQPEVDEFYLPLVHPAPATLLDYLPHRALVVVDDLDTLQMTATEIEEQAVQLRHECVLDGTLPADYPTPYLSWSELLDSLGSRAWFELGRSTAPEDAALGGAFSAQPRFGGQMRPLLDQVAERLGAGEQVYLVSRQAARLKEVWQERPEAATLAPQFVEGALSEGWALAVSDGKRFHLLTDSEIFGWERPKPRQRPRPVAETPESVYADLKPGDWVVHMDYGIGRYGGLVKRSLEGVERDFLQLEYDSGDQLYVPVHQADRVTRYIGPGGEPPSPTRLGTAEWSSAKQRVREGVQQVARDLLDLYAQRQLVQGYAFSPDTLWQQELEASFAYSETDDQLRAITDAKRDMESQLPMDRLLCGDVGYGKTEVALRAAFKAVMDGKQVAVLVPTTVLAQQHYETFRQRLAPFPVEVEMLSRFRSPKEQEKILNRLAQGGIDIVIGTHRLVQSDVKIKDLGLVVVDEEQRFGVTHKEYLKRLRTEVDVLTMTATPIPRTLYMALTGVRDISTINTPPEERLPVVTHIGPYSPRLVRQSILRELERGGQVFFVHNRVQTIPAMVSHLRQLVPEARLGFAHGQMPENELSEVMRLFTHGEIDVLLSTSIIESGLDIPNANTLIVDRADTFGLGQLYQLRGRVGRGAQRAYAYFFRHRRKAPTPEGLERMEIIAENSQLGAGYSIAMRDLEMRGAGELLGTRQHGYINAVGFHLYTRLLGQAVRELVASEGIKGALAALPGGRNGRLPVSVDLPIAVGIPIDYVPNQNLRLQLYRRLADLESEEEVQTFAEELNDRFGTIPTLVENLLYQMKVKLRAEQAHLASVVVEGTQLVLRFPPLPEGVHSRKLPFILAGVRAGKNAYWMPMDAEESVWRETLLQALSAIIDWCQPS
ncbi:MAG: transcription-repair coupling factor, partial [Anaerolineaceae bacterium]|nr:transcription-repair coupling factor [Anaerolineaceae bacterium]